MIYEHGSLSAVPAYGLQERSPGSACCYNLILYKKMTSQLFSRLQQSMINPRPTPPPSTAMYLHICKHTGPFYSHLPKQIRAEGRAPTVRAVRLFSLPCRMVTKKKRKGQGGKILFSENTIRQSVCLLMTNVKRKKIFTVSYLAKSVLSLRLNAWVPPAFSVLAIPPLHPRLQRGTCKHIS